MALVSVLISKGYQAKERNHDRSRMHEIHRDRKYDCFTDMNPCLTRQCHPEGTCRIKSEDETCIGSSKASCSVCICAPGYFGLNCKQGRLHSLLFYHIFHFSSPRIITPPVFAAASRFYRYCKTLPLVYPDDTL